MEKEEIDGLWDCYGLAEEECQLAGEPIEVIVQGKDMTKLLVTAKTLWKIKEHCEHKYAHSLDWSKRLAYREILDEIEGDGDNARQNTC